jgi:F-box/WD-40 domain protein 2
VACFRCNQSKNSGQGTFSFSTHGKLKIQNKFPAFAYVVSGRRSTSLSWRFWKRKTGRINKMDDDVEEEGKEFEVWLQNLCDSFFRLTDAQKNAAIEQLIKFCGPDQLRFLSTKLEILVKRDFLKCLPLELCFHVLKWMDPSSLCRCCLVSKKWEKVISNCHQVWQKACACLGMKVNEHDVPKERWKDLYLKAIRKIQSLKNEGTFETTMLHGHTARVFALCYNYGMLATGRNYISICLFPSICHKDPGLAVKLYIYMACILLHTDAYIFDAGSDDRSVRLWDLETGHCQYVLLTHTCADIRFDMDKVVTASFDNTIGMWEWGTGRRLQCYQGHTGAGKHIKGSMVWLWRLLLYVCMS